MKEHETLAAVGAAPALQTEVIKRYSRRGAASSAVARIVAALATCVALLYEKDDDGRLCNVDGLTGEALIPLAWTATTYKAYGLTRTDADVIRHALLRTQDPAALFLYDPATRRWRVNLDAYPDEQAALEWLRGAGWTVRTYRTFVREVREERKRWRSK